MAMRESLAKGASVGLVLCLASADFCLAAVEASFSGIADGTLCV